LLGLRVVATQVIKVASILLIISEYSRFPSERCRLTFLSVIVTRVILFSQIGVSVKLSTFLASHIGIIFISGVTVERRHGLTSLSIVVTLLLSILKF
jgi:hypothetical protein